LASDDKKLLDLVSRCLEFDPSKRIKIEDVIKHPYL
jgi:serine/threonine protein kinase